MNSTARIDLRLSRIGLAWLLLFGFNASAAPNPNDDFTLPPGFEIHLIAAEPEVANPMTLCVDEQGALWVTEAHTYRWGAKGSPVQPPTNPIKRLEPGPDGRAARVITAAEGFAEPVIGIHAREDKLYATCLNELFVMDIGPDGRLSNRKLLVKDAAVPWNPFGMYRVQVGPDDKLWLCIANHPSTEPVTLTGSDGRTVQLRGKSGGLVRCHRDGSGLEILVHGFRAPYAFDVDPWGHLWHISNGEGSPNIYVQVIPGMDYGFATRNRSYAWLAGKEPLAPPVHDLGAGANTAALHYYSSQFPRNFWGGILIANWGSHGANPANRDVRHFRQPASSGSDLPLGGEKTAAHANHPLPLGGGEGRGEGAVPPTNPTGTSRDELAETEKFLTTTDPLFRPTSVVLAPDGGLYVSDWHGRDDENSTAGRIYKIVYTGKDKPSAPPIPSAAELQKLSPPELGKLLGHPNHQVRELAQRALVNIGATATQTLGQIAENDDAFAAAHAIWALTRIDSAAAPALTRALRHRDPRVRAHALRQLRQFAGHALGGEGLGVINPGATREKSLFDPKQLAQLAGQLLRDPDAEVRVEAALALDSPAAVARGLLAALEVADRARLRYQIGFELGRRGDIQALTELRDSAEAGRQRLAWIAADTARHEGSPLADAVQDWPIPSSEKLMPANFLERVASGELKLVESSDKLLALELIESRPHAEAPVEFILAGLSDLDPHVQATALRVVRRGGMTDPRFDEAILRALSDTRAHPVRLEAIYALGLRADDTTPEQWRPWLRHPTRELVIAALRSLRQIGQKSELVNLVRDLTPEFARRDRAIIEEAAFTLRVLRRSAAQSDETVIEPPVNRAGLEREVLARLPKASARLGRFAFDSAIGCCLTCHSMQPGEMRFGPSLAGIGVTPAQYLIESIIDPNKVIKTGFQTETIETTDDRVLSGLVEARGEELIIREAADEQVIVPLNQIRRRTVGTLSPMPEGFENVLSPAELADLTAFLLSLKPTN